MDEFWYRVMSFICKLYIVYCLYVIWFFLIFGGVYWDFFKEFLILKVYLLALVD